MGETKQKRVIANPPIGIYDNPDLNAGQSYYHIMLDLIARYKSKFEGEIVAFPSFSFNVFGRKAERFVDADFTDKKSYEETEKRIIELTNRPSIRSKLNLMSEEKLLDNDKATALGVSRDFQRLYGEGFIVVDGSEAYFDCETIKRKRGLTEKLEEIEFYPPRAGIEMKRMIENNTGGLVKISRSTKYSVQSPIGTENIGPLFNLANLWDHKYPGAKITMAGSNNSISRYIFLRFITRVALDDEPGMDELFVWPRIMVTGGTEKWDLAKLTKDRYQTDILRHAFISSHSNSLQKISIDASKRGGIRNFIYLTANLRKVLDINFERYPHESEFCNDYHRAMARFKFTKALSTIENKIKKISRMVNKHRNNRAKMVGLSSEYMEAVELLNPFIPATCKLIMGRM